jgi:hypothetical protein
VTARVREQYLDFVASKVQKPTGILGRCARFIGGLPAPIRVEMEFARLAEFVLASPVMVNTGLFDPGEEDQAWPGLFLITFDSEVTLGQIANAALLFDEVAAGDATGEIVALQEMLNDEEYRSLRRRPISPRLTGGKQFFLIDLAVPNWYLPGRCIDRDMPHVACLSIPGEFGRTRAIPYWTAFNVPRPAGWESCRLFTGG